MEALGMWDDVLSIVDDETGRDESRLFVQDATWNGTQYIRYLCVQICTKVPMQDQVSQWILPCLCGIQQLPNATAQMTKRTLSGSQFKVVRLVLVLSSAAYWNIFCLAAMLAKREVLLSGCLMCPHQGPLMHRMQQGQHRIR